METKKEHIDYEAKINEALNILADTLQPDLVCDLRQPFRCTGNKISCFAPYGEDKHRSFSFFQNLDGRWLWKDFRDGSAGNLVQLYMKINDTDYYTTLKNLADAEPIEHNDFIEQYETVEIEVDESEYEFNDITFYPLKNTLRDRGIKNIPVELFELKKGKLRNLAIRNIAGGFEIRGGGDYKGSLGTSSITIIEPKNVNEFSLIYYIVVEGMFDWLSLHQKRPDSAYIILNSVNNWAHLPQNLDYITALDNDKYGQETAEKIKENFNVIANHVPTLKDWNDDLVAGHKIPLM